MNRAASAAAPGIGSKAAAAVGGGKCNLGFPRGDPVAAAVPRADHVRIDLNFAQTLKDGEGIADVERNFYTIVASIVYEPFKRQSEEDGS